MKEKNMSERGRNEREDGGNECERIISERGKRMKGKNERA